jgi:NAD(P)-dependent dehydrogenase (short-subunit alcohol dehydrogenase family)
MREARHAFGSLDIVVNCAGFGAIMPLTELTAAKWQSVQAVTLGGVFYGVKNDTRLMLEQGPPGVDMITRCGALELGGRGIRVVGIAPGLVETLLTRKELENPAVRTVHGGHPDKPGGGRARDC